jgi:hypothetical protein
MFGVCAAQIAAFRTVNACEKNLIHSYFLEAIDPLQLNYAL